LEKRHSLTSPSCDATAMHIRSATPRLISLSRFLNSGLNSRNSNVLEVWLCVQTHTIIRKWAVQTTLSPKRGKTRPILRTILQIGRPTTTNHKTSTPIKIIGPPGGPFLDFLKLNPLSFWQANTRSQHEPRSGVVRQKGEGVIPRYQEVMKPTMNMPTIFESWSSSSAGTQT